MNEGKHQELTVKQLKEIADIFKERLKEIDFGELIKAIKHFEDAVSYNESIQRLKDFTKR